MSEGIKAILLISFLLRFCALFYPFHHAYAADQPKEMSVIYIHNDEPMVVNQALKIGKFKDLNPHFFRIPPLTSYLLFLLYFLYFLLGGFTLGSFEAQMTRNPFSLYFIAKFFLGVLAGTATVYFFYCLIKKNFGEKRALISSFLLGVCYLHIRQSSYIYCDIPLLLVLVLAASAFFDKKWVRFSLLCGLCAAFKYNGIFIYFLYLFSERFNFKNFLKITGSCIATLLILNPYCLIDFKFFIQEIMSESHVHGYVGLSTHFNNLIGAFGTPLIGIPVIGSALMGLLSMKRPFFCAFVVFYYLLITFMGQPYERYVLPVLPFLIFIGVDYFVSEAKCAE